MKRMEGILKKLIVIQFIFLLLAQIFLHHFQLFPKFNHLVLYEGVNSNNHEKVVQTFNLP